MKSQELSTGTIVLLVLVLIVISVVIIFAFNLSDKTKANTEGALNIGEGGAQQSASEIDKSIFSINCNARCDSAKAIARTGNGNDICAEKILESEFCEDTIVYDGENIHCDAFYLKEGKDPCMLTFKDGQRSLSCVDYAETC